MAKFGLLEILANELRPEQRGPISYVSFPMEVMDSFMAGERIFCKLGHGELRRMPKRDTEIVVYFGNKQRTGRVSEISYEQKGFFIVVDESD